MANARYLVNRDPSGKTGSVSLQEPAGTTDANGVSGDRERQRVWHITPFSIAVQEDEDESGHKTRFSAGGRSRGGRSLRYIESRGQSARDRRVCPAVAHLRCTRIWSEG